MSTVALRAPSRPSVTATSTVASPRLLACRTASVRASSVASSTAPTVLDAARASRHQPHHQVAAYALLTAESLGTLSCQSYDSDSDIECTAERGSGQLWGVAAASMHRRSDVASGDYGAVGWLALLQELWSANAEPAGSS